MSINLQTIENENRIASHADFAAQNFESCLTAEEAHKFGGEVLADRCIDFRMAAIMLSKSKGELLENLNGKDKKAREEFAETFMTTLERLQDTEKFIKVLAENNERAICRLLCLLGSVIPDTEEETLMAAE